MQVRPRTERFTFKEDVIFNGGGANIIEVVWKSRTHLEITYPTLTSVMRSETRWNNVSIAYREDAQLRDRQQSTHLSIRCRCVARRERVRGVETRPIARRRPLVGRLPRTAAAKPRAGLKEERLQLRGDHQ